MHAGGERRAQAAAAALLLGLLLLPAAAAAGATADFSTGSTLVFPADASLDLAPKAIYMNDTYEVAGLTLVAPRVLVHVGSSTTHAVGVPGRAVVDVPTWPTFSTFELHDVRLRLTSGSGPGFLGVYPQPGATAGLLSAGDLVLTPQATLHVGGTLDDQAAHGEPEEAGYGRNVPGPVLDVRAGGTLTYEGPGIVKLNGPSFVLEARENATPYHTGRRYAGDGPVRGMEETWVTLSFREATLRVEHPRMQVAAASTTVAWTGVATVADMRGEMASEDATYVARGQSVRLDGTFVGTIAAASSASGTPVALGRFEGDLQDTSLAPAAIAPRPVPAWRPLGLGLLLGVAVAVGLTGAYAYRVQRRREPPALSPEQYRDLADAAMENLRFADALEWIEKAQELAPASARLWMDKGYCHASLGDVPEALAAYERAAQLSSDGEADLLAASLLLRAGEPDLAGAERHVERALQRSPAVAIEVQLDSVFDALRERPRVARALRRALGDRSA